MPTAHCLTVEVKGQTSPHTGVGYMIAFSLPANMYDNDPAAHPSFIRWSEAVREIILAAGDLPFHSDAYTRKTALATLMHDLAEINRMFPLRIDTTDDGVPAVQIHSTDPLARQIELDFTDEDGAFSVIDRNPHVSPTAEVRDNGRMRLTTAARTAFPFDKPAAVLPRTPKRRNSQPPRA